MQCQYKLVDLKKTTFHLTDIRPDNLSTLTLLAANSDEALAQQVELEGRDAP